MIREVSLSDISDGKTYELNDMVKADTGGCAGCHACCTGMGSSIVLDPYDVWQMKVELDVTFQQLLGAGYIELNMVDGLILPNLRMNDNERCSFLSDQGRCTIHRSRPGICRIFPLGRIYDGKDFKYFLQKEQCAKEARAKIKVKKWIDVENVTENHRFINQWHYFVRWVGDKNIELKNTGRGECINDIAMYVLNEFFVTDILNEEQKAVADDGLFYMLVINMLDVAKKSIEELC